MILPATSSSSPKSKKWSSGTTQVLLGLQHVQENFGFNTINDVMSLLFSDNQGGLAWTNLEDVAKQPNTR